MDSQLSTYPLIALLKHYPKASFCRRAPRCLRTTPSSSKSIHSLPRCRRHRATLQAERSRRRFQSWRKPSADRGFLSLPASSAKFDSTQAHTAREGRQGASRGHERKPADGERVAVLGGGISGLAYAYYLAKEFPATKITIFEASNRLGGWLNTQKVNVGDGTVIFEQGPRTLQPHTISSIATLSMIHDLGIQDEIIYMHNVSPAARNRFIYYPDHLVKMPGGDETFSERMASFWTESIYKGVLKAAKHDIFGDGRDESLRDESVSSFFNRRFHSPDLTNNIISAVIHGIYAGDIDRLSVKSIFRPLWDMEQSEGSLLLGTIKRQLSKKQDLNDSTVSSSMSANIVPPSLVPLTRNARAFSFRQGIGTLTEALERFLKAKPHPTVEFKMNKRVSRVEYDTESDGIQITTASNHPPAKYTSCISTVPAATLATLTPHLRALKGIHAVTVMVVNLFYRSPDLLRHVGFGYLIPRSIPLSQNPECALGVVFDSFVAAGMDTVPGTKITVMLGGHYWDCFSHYPDEEEGAAMAKRLLKRHLGIDMEPEKILVGLNRDCIPQYYVGHEQRMITTTLALQSKFNRKLGILGSSYFGVGVNDCIKEARKCATRL